MECGIMHFGEFNPLDILAAAATLQGPGHGEGADESQSSDGEGDGEEGAEDGTGAYDCSQAPSLGCGLNSSDSPAKGTFGEIIEDQRRDTFVRPETSPPKSVDQNTMPRIVKVLSNNGRLTEKLDTDDKLVLSPKETVTMTGTNSTGTKDCTTKTVTILRVKKTPNVDHSYAVYSKLEKARMEDDEGYCSRSSLGSPGQCWKSDSEMMDPDVLDGRDSECGPKSPYLVLPAGGQSVKNAEALSPPASAGHSDSCSSGLKSPTSALPEVQVNVSEAAVDGQNKSSSANRKCTKIVIVSRDANLRKYFSTDIDAASAERWESPAEEHGCNPSESSTELKQTAQSHKAVTAQRMYSSTTGVETSDTVKADASLEHQEKLEDSSEIKVGPSCADEKLSKGSLCDETNPDQKSDDSKGNHDNKETSGAVCGENHSASTVASTSESVVGGECNKNTDILDADSACASEAVPENVTDATEIGVSKSDRHHSPALLNMLVSKSPTVLTKSEQTQDSDSNLDQNKVTASITSVFDSGTVHVQGQHPVMPGTLPACSLQNGSSEKDVTSSSACGMGNASSKDLVYIMSTTASDVMSNTAVMSPNGAKLSSPGQCNKYIIQDDVPPMSKYGEATAQTSKTDTFSSALAQTCQTLEPNTKLCSSKPKLMAGSKESFVLLRLSNLSTKPSKSGLVTLNPGVKSPTPSSVVPVLVNAGSSLPHSLLPTPAKSSSSFASGSQPTICVSPQGMTKSNKLVSPCLSACLPKKTELNMKEDSSSTTTTAIPRSWSSLLSSHKLLSCNSLIAMQPLTSSPEPVTAKKVDSADSSAQFLTVTARGDSHNTRVCDSNDNGKPDLDTSALSDSTFPTVSCLGQRTMSCEGRLTPLGFTAAGAEASSSTGGNINIKISGGVVVDVQQEKGVRDLKNKSSCSIGQVGSLTWQNVSPPVIESAARFLPVRHSRTMLGGPVKKDGLSDALLVELKKKHPKARAGMPSRAELYRMKESAQNISELHPLIDHDYCMFTEFSADIQSSIIATMDTKIKPERKSIKKTKVARTKFYQAPAAQAKLDPKLKKRKYTKRKLNQLLQRVKNVTNDVSSQNDGTDEKESSGASSASDSVFLSGQLKEKFRDRKPKRHYRPRNSGDKNYVKIPGSYQDEFVYYATKKQRGRPRKFEEEHPETTVKSGITSINEFEWYREMAKIDKGRKFGIASVGANNITKPNSLELLQKVPDYGHGANGSIPIQESDVVDMVIDMMPSPELDVTPTMDSSKIFGSLINNETGHGENMPTDGRGDDTSTPRLNMAASSNEESIESTVDPGVMAEFNRLLNSMEEAEQLKILANLTEGQASTDKQDKDRDGLGKADSDNMLNNLNAYLGSYSNETHNVGQPLSVGQSQSQFLDLDEINDNDLLNTSELGNIFGDLTTASTTSTTTSLAVMTTAGDSLQKMPDSDFTNFADSSCSSYSMESSTAELTHMEPPLPNAEQTSALGGLPAAFGKPLDKRELFPDISSTVPQVSSEFGVPDLTLVNMYWNELPGLLINGKEYVRLVDIHKQVLPAKDTGILKKRCQMMGLEIMNCSELQRDFLIRYMNAAKSKSCVIVAKDAAKTLIGFYVDPRPRMLNRQPSEPYAATKQRSGPSKLKVLLPSRKESKVNNNADGMLVTSDSVPATSSTASTSNGPTAAASKSGKQKGLSGSRQSNSADDTCESGTYVVNRPKLEVNMKHIKRSPRLKNKKVMYAALHNGGWTEEDEPSRTQSPDYKSAGDSVASNSSEDTADSHPEEKIGLMDTSESDLKTVALKDSLKSRHLSSADKVKLSELVTKQGDCKLSSKERRRINRLQKKIRKHKLLSHHDEIELLDKWLKNLEKAKLRRLEKKAHTDKYSLEHCYAASPEPQDHNVKCVKVESANAVCTDTATDSKHLNEPSVQNNNSTTLQISHQSPCNKTMKHSGTLPAESKSRPRLKVARLANGDIQQTLQVVHMDSVQRSHSQKNHSQDGTLYLSKYQSREAACIECNTCHEMLSVRRFLKHRHHLNNPDELVEVSLPQKLELSPPPQADVRSDEVHLWAQFTQRRQTFSQLLPRRRQPSKVRASTKRRPVVHRIRGGARKQFELVSKKASDGADDVSDRDEVDVTRDQSGNASQTSLGSAILDDSSRHSGRVRKRKQLYPMESYVFGRSPRQGSPVTKRARYSVPSHGSPT